MSILPAAHLIAADVARALAEDIGVCDWTACLVDARASGSARVIARQAAVIAGQAWFDECFRQVDARTQVRWLVAEGAWVEPDTLLCEISGPARALLTAERSALNFLQTLSATATVASRHDAVVAGTRARVYDTRKTLPRLRLAPKYAETVGGGEN